MSLAVGSTNAAPMATSKTPTVDAFVSACIRDEHVAEAHDADRRDEDQHAPRRAAIASPITRRAPR